MSQTEPRSLVFTKPLTLTFRYAGEDGDLGVIEEMRDELLHTIKKTFDVSSEQASQLFLELRQCIKRRNLITIFRCSSDRGDNKSSLDEVILTALFKAQQLHPFEQLSLALTWNRCDIAKKEIFTYGNQLSSSYRPAQYISICFVSFRSRLAD